MSMVVGKPQTVKEKYNGVSETFLYDLKDRNVMGQKYHYDWWMKMKDVAVKDLTFEDTMRLSKIEDLQARAFKRPKWGR